MQVDEIRDYYERTYWDYRLIWTDQTALACHFGYFDGTVRTHAQALLRTNEIIADRAGIVPDARVLDAGCGLGGTAFWLAEKRGATVLGANLSERQIADARQTAQQRGLAARVSFAQTDFAEIDAPDGSFDVVIAIESLCHSPRKEAFITEASRLLRPGGRLLISDYLRVREAGDMGEELMLDEWCDGWTIAALSSVDELEGVARDAGFASVEVTNVTSNMQPSLRRLFNVSALALPGSAILTALGLRSARGHRNVVASKRQYEALQCGLWQYFHVLATKPATA